MTNLQAYLQSYFELSVEHIVKIEGFFKENFLNKNEFLTKTGRYNVALSFIHSGYLRIYEITEGKEVTQWISSDGEFITDLGSLMFQAPAKRNIQALTDCRLYTINHSDYQKIGDIISDWNRLEKLFLGKCFMTLEDRVFSFLSFTAEQRYQQLFDLKKDLFNHVPLQYIASMLGMTPETLSRIRNKNISN